MHILLLTLSCSVTCSLYDDAKLSHILSVSGPNVALYCANRFHIELRQDAEYHNNLDNAVERVFFRLFDKIMYSTSQAP